MGRGHEFQIGASVMVEDLDRDPHAVAARLRGSEPVSWLPAAGGWLVTRYDLAVAVMRDAERFTVEDARFSTARVIGPSMLSLDGTEHRRHRAPFVEPFRARAVRARFAEAVAREADRLLGELAPAGRAELRRSYAGRLAAGVVALALGLEPGAAPSVLAWYDAIAAAVTEITARRALPAAGRGAFAALDRRLRAVIDGEAEGSLLASVAASSDLSAGEIVSDAAVLLFGGIDTSESMIANALMHVLVHPEALAGIRRDSQLLEGAIEESLRLEPSASVIDRYATRDTELAGASIAAGELVRVSIAGANRDPAVFPDPDRFDPGRPNARRHLSFARGPHVCLGLHLARLEARCAVDAALSRLPHLRLDPVRPPEVSGLVFRKPRALHARWDAQ
jgi:cytochrome P450